MPGTTTHESVDWATIQDGSKETSIESIRNDNIYPKILDFVAEVRSQVDMPEKTTIFVRT